MTTFPILIDHQNTPHKITSVPWAMLVPHRQRAMINHDQSLERLAERGGLTVTEILAVIDDTPWFDAKMKYKSKTSEERQDVLIRRVKEWEAAQ